MTERILGRDAYCNLTVGLTATARCVRWRVVREWGALREGGGVLGGAHARPRQEPLNPESVRRMLARA